jgi:hypothetical protein
MSYIGNTSSVQQYAPQVAYFSGDASTVAFTLPVSVVSAAQIIVAVANVIQNPSSAFTVSGTTLTFTSAPPSGTNNIWVQYTTLQTNIVQPAAASVGPTQINSNYSLLNKSGSNSYTTGTLSIGTSTPDSSNTLQVAGDIGVSWAANEFIGMKFGSGSSYKMGLMLNDVTRECKVWSQSVDSDDKITFYTGSTPSERMRITSSGNVGIGTSSPATKLTVYNDVAARYHQIFNITRPSSTTPALFMGTNGNSNDAAIAGNNSNITFGRDQSDTYTEYMRVVNGGGVRFMCENFANIPSSTNWGVEIHNTGSGSRFFGQGTGTETQIEFGNRNGTRGSIQTTSGGTSYNTTSDYRLKENVTPMTGALAKVAQLNPVTYNWKIGGSGQGFIAHELQAVVPDAVTGEKDAVDENDEPKYQMVDTSFLVATLTAAIQEQQALIESLTARITSLESK